MFTEAFNLSEQVNEFMKSFVVHAVRPNSVDIYHVNYG